MKPCEKCACSGHYVDFGGSDVGALVVDCPECKGKGWLNDDGTPMEKNNERSNC